MVGFCCECVYVISSHWYVNQISQYSKNIKRILRLQNEKYFAFKVVVKWLQRIMQKCWTYQVKIGNISNQQMGNWKVRKKLQRMMLISGVLCCWNRRNISIPSIFGTNPTEARGLICSVYLFWLVTMLKQMREKCEYIFGS